MTTVDVEAEIGDTQVVSRKLLEEGTYAVTLTLGYTLLGTTSSATGNINAFGRCWLMDDSGAHNSVRLELVRSYADHGVLTMTSTASMVAGVTIPEPERELRLECQRSAATTIFQVQSVSWLAVAVDSVDVEYETAP